jgi:hypothetical protein
MAVSVRDTAIHTLLNKWFVISKIKFISKIKGLVISKHIIQIHFTKPTWTSW